MKTYLFSNRFLYEATNQLWSRFLHEATGSKVRCYPDKLEPWSVSEGRGDLTWRERMFGVELGKQSNSTSP